MGNTFVTVIMLKIVVTPPAKSSTIAHCGILFVIEHIVVLLNKDLDKSTSNIKQWLRGFIACLRIMYYTVCMYLAFSEC